MGRQFNPFSFLAWCARTVLVFMVLISAKRADKIAGWRSPLAAIRGESRFACSGRLQ
ncbi:hypothetical protein GCM10007171_05010 [Dickeya fangzhongdai]|nr:hypothetical protein GCM10007171_05010 [Dickeya fangzhongdai]